MSIPLTVEGADLSLMNSELAPGIHGYAIEGDDGAIYIPVIAANDPGKGNVGRFLDALPSDKTIKFPCVISERLTGMLKRRGFTLTVEDSDHFGPVEVWVRAMNTSSAPP